MGSLVAAFRPGALVSDSLTKLLTDITRFSELVLRLPLRPYQIRPLRAILSSVLRRQGLEFLLVFPRQSGKNEAVAHLLAYLLNIYRRAGGNIVYGAEAASLALGIERLEARMDNVWNQGAWKARAKPNRRSLDRATVVFLSTNRQAQARGQTAHHLLVIDETQDQEQAHIEAVFTPMRAACNATAVYIGTVKLTSDYLWQKKLQLEREQAADGIQRVFTVQPETVIDENPLYREFLDAQVRLYGRSHPIVASEYFLEPVDGTGGLFDARRRALMQGSHTRERQPQVGALYVATLDVAGEDEAATDPIARLANPARDYTVATVFRVDYGAPRSESQVVAQPLHPIYRAVDVFVDHGSKHFQEGPGRPALAQRLLAWLTHWQAAHLICDESGVGLGLTGWLASALGESRVTGFSFSGTGAKAALGSAFLSLVETGRFRYWREGQPLGDRASPREGASPRDAWWFWRQVEACTYEVPPDGRFDRDLRWGVPASHRTPTPTGPQPTHDDRLISAALVAELDRMLRTGKLRLGSGQSAVIGPADPLAQLGFRERETW